MPLYIILPRHPLSKLHNEEADDTFFIFVSFLSMTTHIAQPQTKLASIVQYFYFAQVKFESKKI
jgi:hypothetical protein